MWRGRVLGGPAAGTACGGHLSMPWFPPSGHGPTACCCSARLAVLARAGQQVQHNQPDRHQDKKDEQVPDELHRRLPPSLRICPSNEYPKVVVGMQPPTVRRAAALGGDRSLVWLRRE